MQQQTAAHPETAPAPVVHLKVRRFLQIPFAISVLLTGVFLIAGVVGIGSAIACLWILAAPALLLANESYQIMAWLPPAVARYIPSHHVLRTIVFFDVCLLWTAFLSAPWWFFIGLNRRARMIMQIILLVVGGCIVWLCFLYVFRTFPSPG